MLLAAFLDLKQKQSVRPKYIYLQTSGENISEFGWDLKPFCSSSKFSLYNIGYTRGKTWSAKT